jgi:hypothetical protein
MNTKIGIGGAILLVLALLFIGSRSSGVVEGDGTLVSSKGLHAHPELTIYVKGQQITIPGNIGLLGGHKAVHTHDDLPIIHLEFDRIVREEDIMLGEFFKNWGKDIHSFGENMHMTVNGVENTEYESYIMRDTDKIKLEYD